MLYQLQYVSYCQNLAYKFPTCGFNSASYVAPIHLHNEHGFFVVIQIVKPNETIHFATLTICMRLENDNFTI